MLTTADKKLAALYPAHLDTIREQYDEALAATQFDAAIIGAGSEMVRYFDDQTYPFRPNPHIVQWLPLLQHPESALIYRPGKRPQLLIYQPDDFWYAPPELPGEPWAQHFDMMAITRLDDIDEALKRQPGRVAWLGNPAQWRHDPPKADRNPDNLLKHLHFYRPFRTDYEVECIRLATHRAVPAHRAAEQAFHAGESEYDILLAFLNAGRCTENELPYPAIVAKNTHGAVLHYQHYDREPGHNHSLLLDAGCGCNGYASDITRTHDGGDRDFRNLIAGLDAVQQTLTAQVAPGKPFAELHADTHVAIGELLKDAGIVSPTLADPVAAGITSAFFPHGLGHFLGLQVHEVGGSYADPAGTEIERPERYPNLRLVRTLEAGQVLTIEPGLYFIDSLLEDLRAKPIGTSIDWKTVERLKKFGGIRIEDNILVTADGHQNITRRAFGP